MTRPRSHRAFTGVPLALALCACLSSACDGGGPPRPAPLPPLPDPPQPRAGTPAGEVRPTRELTLVLSGDVRGEIEPCGCPTLPFGGFERRERLLAGLPALGPVFQLDAGELLTKGVSTWREDQRGRAEVLLRASAAVGVDAWVPGPSDLLALPVEALRRAPAPLALSATWTDAQGTLLFPPATVLARDGRRVGVIGLSAAPTAPEVQGQVLTRDPVQAAREALATLPADLDLVVALGSVTDEEADRVAREVPGLAAVLTTAGRDWDETRMVAGVPVVEALDRGRYLQVLSTHLGSTPDHPLQLTPDAPAWRNLMTLRRQAGPEGSPALAAAEASLRAQAAGRNLAWLESRPLGEDLDGPARVTPLLGAFKQRTLDEATARARAPAAPAEPGFATAAACTTCHLDEFARWSFTDHSKAWQSLVVRQSTENGECLPCHSTGFGQAGGFGAPTTAAVRAFKSVQCEACHGPMKRHPDDPTVKGAPITPERCTGCHDAANSPDFDYATYLPRATCQGGAPELRPL